MQAQGTVSDDNFQSLTCIRRTTAKLQRATARRLGFTPWCGSAASCKLRCDESLEHGAALVPLSVVAGGTPGAPTKRSAFFSGPCLEVAGSSAV